MDLLLGGAVDYVTKPFSIKEILARIAVQLRRASKVPDVLVLIFEDITLNTDTYTVSIGENDEIITCGICKTS